MTDTNENKVSEVAETNKMRSEARKTIGQSFSNWWTRQKEIFKKSPSMLKETIEKVIAGFKDFPNFNFSKDHSIIYQTFSGLKQLGSDLWSVKGKRAMLEDVKEGVVELGKDLKGTFKAVKEDGLEAGLKGSKEELNESAGLLRRALLLQPTSKTAAEKGAEMKSKVTQTKFDKRVDGKTAKVERKPEKSKLPPIRKKTLQEEIAMAKAVRDNNR